MSGTAFSESDCCGNGCVNCVLNEKPKQRPSSELDGRSNLIENYTSFQLKSKRNHTKLCDILELHFVSCLDAPVKEAYVLKIPSGSHVMMRAPTTVTKNGKTKRLLRPYSPYYVDSQNLEFSILVNLKPNGPMSTYISGLEEGNRVEFRGPIESPYKYEPSHLMPKKLYIFSQGIALAPTLHIIEEILANEDDLTSIVHLACFVDLEHVFFRERLRDYGRYWNYDVRIYLSRQQCGSSECQRNGRCMEECGNLKEKLFYKEQVFLRRITEMELRKSCRRADMREMRFVVAGTRTFQYEIADAIQRLDMGACEENICLL